MAFKMDPSQLKLAEKLVILNDRATGMLTRLYNIKKGSTEAKSKPGFLSDKQMESALKLISRKFPVLDTRNNQSTFSYAASIKKDIVSSLSLYYYTIVDLMDLKDNIMRLLTDMDACQCHLDISINFELTSGYLNLVVNLVSLMILLSRIEDRKSVLGLFNAAYDLSHGQSEASFPRLAQMVLDYENPLKRLSEDLGPLNRLIHSSIVSLSPIYTRRNISAENWRRADLLSLTVNPQQIHFAAQTDVISCEYLSLDVMDRWILYCATLCHNPLLNNEIVQRLWQITLEMGLCIRIFRDEVFIMHQELQVFFDSFKGLHKRSQEVKDYYSIALQQSAAIHADRRRFLRTTLRELTLLLQDQPGLLGPKILFVWMGLSFSRDEIMWLLRHINEWPSSKKGNKGVDELQDKQLPELIHYVLELRDLVIKYSGVIQRYYLQYVANYDAFATCEVISSCNGLSEYDAVILSDFADSISSINSDTDLRALRLDWFRFQAHTSFARSSFSLHQQGNRKLAIIMNTNVFHLKMIDLQDEMLRETSDLSIYCFYPRELERQWRSCLQLPGQSRFALAFARVAAHFNSALHDICPEEKVHITERALNVTATVLDDICHTVSEVVGNLCVYELRLSEQTSTSQVAQMLAQQMQKGKAGKNTAPQKDFICAGEESHRTDRQRLTYSDKLQTTLVELCAGLSHLKQITVADHIFAPREYLSQHLENRFVEMILETASIDASIPRRPSELLMAVQSFMNVLQNIDTCVAIDITLIFNSALLQQSQPLDSRNRDTLTAIYTKWYLEVVLRRASTSLMVWSEHLQAMVSYADANPFSTEQYTDPLELRSLAQILGPYGVKYFSERLIWHVSCQITELHKVIIANKEVLQVARSQFDNSEKLKEIIGVMSTESKDKKNANNACPSDCVLQRTAIMGEIFMLRDALRNALKQVLAQRLPFLTAAFNNLHESLDDEGKTLVSELASAMGIVGKVDMSLVHALRAQNPNMHQGEFYMLSCLLLVAIAISLPRISLSQNSSYKPSIKGTMNNTHCIPVAINTVASALFHLHEQNDTHQRMKEFLALASSSILRNAQESENKESKESPDRCQTALYIMLEQLVNGCDYLTMDYLEACFPYNLVRTAYQQCYEQEREVYN